MRRFAELADLRGRGALVVGGSGHVGRVVCRVLTELGAEVVAADRRAAPCPEVATLDVDLTDEVDTRGVIGRAVDHLGTLDILVHAAAYTAAAGGSGWATDFEDQSVAAWDLAHRVNVTSAFVLAQEARPHLDRGGHGAVLLVSSIYGVVGPDFDLYAGTAMRNPAAYGASKAGLLQLTRHLAMLFAPSIRVNALSPGGIERGQEASFVARYERGTPLGRMATEEDLAGAVAYLCSDLSAYVTGTNLLVDGGWTAR